MRQMGAYNRDASMAKQAEHQLKAAEQACRNSESLPRVQNDLRDVQQVLGLHELDIARFYIDNRRAYKAGESRLRGIINNYPFFSYVDESLYRLGVTLIEQEQPEEAADFFNRLVRDYPNSEFSKKGREYLEKLGKPIPTPNNNNPAPERPSFMGKFGLILGRNGLDIPEDGVLLTKKGSDKEDVRDATKPSEASNASGTRAIRASTKGTVVTSQSEAPQPAAAVQPGNGSDNSDPTESKTGDDKSNDKKDSKKKKPKEKKGFLGIFK
jgi:outer membrane protein assembly factor BamD